MNKTGVTLSQPGRLRRLALSWALILGAMGLATLTIVGAFGNHHYSDFGVFWHAGKHVLAGQDPYPDVSFRALKHQDQFVYPAFAAVIVAPFALLPLGISALLFLVLSIIAVAASLRVVGVRDPRCYAATFISLATIQGLVMGTVTPALMLTLALAWRFRNTVRWIAVSAAAAVGLKLFLAPTALWLVATRRWRALGLALAIATASLSLAWVVVGLSTLRSYPALLSELTKVEGRSGFSTYALILKLGGSRSVAQAVVVLVVVILAGICIAIGRRPGGDQGAFTIAVTACLIASPIVWLHYFALLIVPIAVLSRTLSWIWALPSATWLFPNANTPAPIWKLVAAHLVLVAVVTLAVRSREPDREAEGQVALGLQDGSSKTDRYRPDARRKPQVRSSANQS
jgi:alpha-1,2-mannosyltransferase